MAVPELLEILYLKGCIVTLDAMGCQKEISKKITTKKADYVLALKRNHENLYDDVRFYFENEQIKKVKVTEDKKHGRIEKREYFLETNIDWLDSRSEWSNLNGIGMVKSTVSEKGKNQRGNEIFHHIAYECGFICQSCSRTLGYRSYALVS